MVDASRIVSRFCVIILATAVHVGPLSRVRAQPPASKPAADEQFDALYQSGSAWWAKGVANQAIAKAEAAVELADKEFGPESEQSGKALRALATYARYSKPPAEVAKHAQRGLRIEKRHRGETIDAFDTMLVLIHCYNRQRHFNKTELLCLEWLPFFNDKLGPEHKHKRLEFLNRFGWAVHQQKKLAASEKISKKLVELQEKWTPDDLVNRGDVLQRLATALNMQKKHVEAEAIARKSLAIRKEHVKRSGGAKLAQLRLADGHWLLAANLGEQYPRKEQRLREAVSHAETSVAIHKAQDSPPHTNNLLAVTWTLARALQHLGRGEEHRRLVLQLYETRRKHQGDEHPRTLMELKRYCFAIDSNMPFRESEPWWRLCVKLHRKVHGDTHDLTIDALKRFERRLYLEHQFVEALELGFELLSYTRRRYGENHMATAGCYNDLAITLGYQNKPAQAARMLKRAMAISERLGHGDTLNHGIYLHNLSGKAAAMNSIKEAVALSRKALEIHERRKDEPYANPEIIKLSLAAYLSDLGQYEESDDLHNELMDSTLSGLAKRGLAVTKMERHDFATADKLLTELVDERRRSEGQSGDTSEAGLALRQHLAYTRYFLGDVDSAIKLLQESERHYADLRRNWALSGLDRALTLRANPSAVLAAIYAEQGRNIEAWKKWESTRALGLLDELAYREQSQLSTAEREARRKLLDEISELEAELRDVATESEGHKEDFARLAELNKQRFAIEKRLMNVVSGAKTATLEQLQAALPPDGALVGWVDPFPTHAKGLSSNHWGVVVRKQGEPHWVKLQGGAEDGSWTVDDRLLRPNIAAQLGDVESTSKLDQLKQPLNTLLRRRLEPLEPMLAAMDGLPAAKQLVVIPTSAVRGVPLQALTSDYSVSYAPSATVYVYLSKRQRERSKGGPPNMFAVADPAFSPANTPRLTAPDEGLKEVAVVLRDAASDGDLQQLPGTRFEVSALEKEIRGSDGSMDLLLGEEATESALRSLNASHKLRDYRYLHLATHGLVNAQEPMRSALALAPDRSAGRATDDERLTAGEILADWELNAELVTLSACQTALGRYAEGEGHIGFAQSLLLAGADSVLLSMWKVDDSATALLMHRFYQNLLGTRAGLDKAMPKHAALHEAQLWLKNLSKEEARRLVAELPQLQRGKKTRRNRKPLPLPKHDGVQRPYAHPYFWSGFVLIGQGE